MDEYKVYQKVKEAIEAVESYQRTGKKGLWKSDIEKGLETLTEKRHMLASSGQACSCCNGSGRA
jgi:ribulose 1,5-bisphosphate carboxylase large subunit-like protein